MLPAHENCAFRASLGLYTFLSGSGRSPILVVGHSFRRCDQSGKYVPPETAGPLPRARGQASAGDRRYTVVSGPSLSLFAWRDALVNVKPETFLGWHRK